MSAGTHRKHFEGVDIHSWGFYNVKFMPSSGIYMLFCYVSTNGPKPFLYREGRAATPYEDIVCEAKDGTDTIAVNRLDVGNAVHPQTYEGPEDLNNNRDLVECISEIQGKSAELFGFVDYWRQAGQSNALLRSYSSFRC